MSSFDTIDTLNADTDIASEKRVLVRVDLNSPISDGAVQDNRRFERHAQTVQELSDAGYHVILLAHQGRPGDDDFVSLEGHASVLETYLDCDVKFIDDTYGSRVGESIGVTEPGDVLLLENTRMCEDELPEADPETKADTTFVQSLSDHVDAYVNDAYSAAHRSHASLVGFPGVLPSYAGRVMETEYEANTAIAKKEFDGTVIMAVGGTKATDVIDVIDNLGESVDSFLLGGVVGELFLRASDIPVGFDISSETDRYDTQWERNSEVINSILTDHADQITLANDLAYDDAGERAEVAVDSITDKSVSFMDIGTATAELYADMIRDADAAFVKGALGVFENKDFAVGTVQVLEAIAETECFSVVGGGDTSRAIEMYDMNKTDFDHVSIAGGAYIRALTGEPLAGIEALESETV